jgi:hypothetical protein
MAIPEGSCILKGTANICLLEGTRWSARLIALWSKSEDFPLRLSFIVIGYIDPILIIDANYGRTSVKLALCKVTKKGEIQTILVF